MIGQRRWFSVGVNSQCGPVGTDKRFPGRPRWLGFQNNTRAHWWARDQIALLTHRLVNLPTDKIELMVFTFHQSLFLSLRFAS